MWVTELTKYGICWYFKQQLSSLPNSYIQPLTKADVCLNKYLEYGWSSNRYSSLTMNNSNFYLLLSICTSFETAPILGLEGKSKFWMIQVIRDDGEDTGIVSLITHLL